MTIEGSGSPAEEFEITETGDARPAVEEFKQEITPVVYRDTITGAKLDPRNISFIKDTDTGELKPFNPPVLSPQEQEEAATALQEALEANQVRYPEFAAQLINNPERIWLMAEIQMMLSPEPNNVSYDFTGELTDAITSDTGARKQYEIVTAANQTQQLFWNDYGRFFPEAERNMFIDLLAQLSPGGANRVAARALLWADERNMDTAENQAQFVLNLFNWGKAEEQHELGESNPFFRLLDQAQEEVSRLLIQPALRGLTSFLSGSEEAARRRDLTTGELTAYTFGLRPPEEAGDWGWWRAVSGAVDATEEIAGDPLALLAGLGAGGAAISRLPLAIKATKAGRAAMATRALLPKFFTGATRKVTGGRAARVLYAFQSKTADELLERTIKNGVAEEALRLLKSDNPVRFARRFPMWANMPEEMTRVVMESVETPEEFIQVLKSGSVNEFLNSGRKLDELERLKEEGWEAARRHQSDEALEARPLTEVEAERLVGPFIDEAPVAEKIRTVDAEILSEKARLLADENIPRHVRLEAGKRQLAFDAANKSGSRPFILTDVPQRSKRIFSAQKMLEKSTGTSRWGRGFRRVIARATPGRPKDEIELFRTREGMEDLTRLFEHFGMRQDKIENLLKEFRALDLGARQDWFWDVAMRELGKEIKVPAYEHNLIQFFKDSKILKFSASDTDIWVDGAGIAHRHPILSSQYSAKMPIPLAEMDQVRRRAAKIGKRSKIARAMGWNGRGLLGPTKARRIKLVRRLRNQLGEDAEGMTDDQLFDIAFSMVSSETGLDGRSWLATWKMMPKPGSTFNALHRWFTRAMLVLRPGQWAWRVALLEEPIRAHLFNMPSLYTNPLQWGAAVREAHWINMMATWAEKNSAWGHDIFRTITSGASKNEMLRRLDDFNLTKTVFPDVDDVTKLAVSDIRRGVSRFINDAIYSRTRINRLNPVKRVPFLVKRRAKNVERAQKALKKFELPDTFSFAKDAAPINQKFISGLLGERVGASDRKVYQYTSTLTNSEAMTHGQVWGAKMIELVEDPFGRIAIHRAANNLRRAGPPAGADASAVLNRSQWDMIRHDLSLHFGADLTDIELAGRYMDEILQPEVEHLFKPFIDNLNPDEAADLLDDFANSKRIETVLDGNTIEWNLGGNNVGRATRDVGDFVASIRGNTRIDVPNNLPAPSFDPRFMAEDDIKWPARIVDWTLQTFGEGATQALNRRPAWLHTFKRYFDNYTNMGVPRESAQRLAIDQANRMINHVFFNMDEAPHYAAKLNQFLPFFGAAYEVMGTWAYKMPVAVGGTWPTGIGEFARKFDRLMDAFTNIGLVSRTEEDDGTITHTLNLVPPDSSALAGTELGRFLQGAGFAMVSTLEESIATLLGLVGWDLTEGRQMREQGLRLATGHPLNPTDFGMLSFAQTNIGLNPVTNIAVSRLAAMIPGATAPERTPVLEGETLADVAERLDMDVSELVRYNREIFVDTEDFGSTDLYNGLLADEIDPEALVLPANSIISLNVPRSSLWDVFRDLFIPFGPIDSSQEFAINHLPGTMRWALMGLALQNQPTDEFWKDTEQEGIFGGMLAPLNEAMVASQLSEQFMFLEAHDLVNSKGPLARILEKEKRFNDLPEDAFEERNALRSEIHQDTEAFLSRVQKGAAESFFLRSLTGQFLPTSPGHVRKEQEIIQQYWDSREHADSIRAGEGIAPKLNNFKSIEDIENYYELLSAWLNDPTGDRARAVFRQNNPQLQAYLTPKTFYKDPVGPVTSYEEYQRQIEAGEREPAPLHVTTWRARSAAIQADYYNKYIARFGNDPHEAAANALNDRQQWQTLRDQRDVEYQALEMWDDMHGSVYDNWRKENINDVETWAEDRLNEKLFGIKDSLEVLFELEDNLEIEFDLQGVEDLNSTLRGAIAELSSLIRDYRGLQDQVGQRNAYENAINQYFEEVYVPFSESISALYDQLPEAADSEKQSLIYEQIKFLKNQHAGSTVYLEGNTEVPFPNPLDYSWQGKSEEEQEVKMQQWLTRPLEWIDQDQALRIVESNPVLDEFLPTADSDFDIYRQYTLAKIDLDEQFEQDEITRSQRNKGIETLDERLNQALILNGREREVQFRDMTPIEKLELADKLPRELETLGLPGTEGGILTEWVRYYKQALDAAEESPGTVKGRRIWNPLWVRTEQAFYRNPGVRSAIQQLSVNLQDEDTLDQFIPWFYFGYTGER